MPFDDLRPAPVGGFKASTAVGYAITTAPDEYGVMDLLELWVTPACRRRGSGRRLIEMVRQWGAEHGAKRLVVQCSPRNEAGRAFYEALGMKDVAVVYQQDLEATPEEQE